MLTRSIAQSLMVIVPEKGPATITLNADFSAVPQIGTISASGSTITGIGTQFQSGPVPIVAGSVLVANDTGGPLNYIAGGLNSVTNGTALTVVSVASDTSLTVSQTGLSFSGAAFFADRTTTVKVFNAWVKPISGKLTKYGNMNLQGDETIIKIPDYELNPAGNGREIRTNDIIVFGGETFNVTGQGTTLKTVRTAWECICRKVIA